MRPECASDTAPQQADQQRGQGGSANLEESHLEALIDPDRTAIRRKNDQRDQDEEKHKCPDAFGRHKSSPQIS